MIKDIFILNSADLPNELPSFERWYLRYHAPEVISNRGPSLIRFVGYRPTPVVPEALDYGYYNLRVTEAWFRSLAERPQITSGIMTYTWRAPWAKDWSALERPTATPAVFCTVPALPTDVFVGGKFSADEKSILRWYTVTKYPAGVSLAEGEEWFLNVHAKEVSEQSGLIAYFSHRALDIPGRPTPWLRLTELWYENFHAWKNSVIKSPGYTRPPWAKHDRYPFLEPFVDFVSTFLMERPDYDYLKEATPYP